MKDLAETIQAAPRTLAARAIAGCALHRGIKLHTAGMTIDQATDFFVKEGHQTLPVARKEAQRGASDPTDLYYTLGKLEILKLRQDGTKMGDKSRSAICHRIFGAVPCDQIHPAMN